MSSTYNLEEKHKTEVIDGNTIYSKFETFTKSVSNIDPFYYKLLSVYMAIILFGYIINSYNTGKYALFKHRANIKNFNSDSEWISVKREVSLRSWENFSNSVVFPYTMFSSIVPNVVIYFNPVKDGMTYDAFKEKEPEKPEVFEEEVFEEEQIPGLFLKKSKKRI